jgi:hypothetical protein
MWQSTRRRERRSGPAKPDEYLQPKYIAVDALRG